MTDFLFAFQNILSPFARKFSWVITLFLYMHMYEDTAVDGQRQFYNRSLKRLKVTTKKDIRI